MDWISTFDELNFSIKIPTADKSQIEKRGVLGI